MNNTELKAIIKPLLKDVFNVKDTLYLLQGSLAVFASWGAEQFTNYNNKALLFHVSGHHHDGFVLITLDWNDTYIVTIISNSGVINDTFLNVYCDELTKVIDDRIEKIADYVS